MVEEIISMFVGDRENRLANTLDPLVMSALTDLRCSSPYSEPIIEKLIADYYENSSIGNDSDLTDLIDSIYESNLGGQWFNPLAVLMAMTSTISEVRGLIDTDIEDWFSSIPPMPTICKSMFNTGEVRSYG